MNYYGVLPATNKYHGDSTLTYSSSNKLASGQIVEIKIRNSSCLAIVEDQLSKPDFSTNKIEREINGLVLTDNQLKLLRWFREYYPDKVGATAKLFAPSYLSKFETPKTKAHHKLNTDKITPKLNKEQADAYSKIADHGTFLLNGVTGSGKTRIYLEITLDKINSGKSVLILTPEIALTAPLEQKFKSVFKDIVVTNHSNLTPKQKLEIYKKIYQGNSPLVIIGPRSSLFLPINNLGLIVVDEFHDTSYKQESSPRYLANRVASKLSEITKSTLLFGSATPSVNDYFLAEQKKGTILNINTSAITNKPPVVRQIIVDLSDKAEQTSYPLISKSALQEMSKALGKNEQILVYINKRGSFRSILCSQCGWKFNCPNCELPLIYHQDIHSAICHTCGYKANIPSSCLSCASTDIFFTSPGTKSIVSSLSKAFPGVKISRYDKDNRKDERIERNFQAISKGDVDIIVGTQMISKGFDLPKLSLVVMLITESSLNFPDYTSGERSYQLIKQLSGRVNRGHREGKVLLQTFSPQGEIADYNSKHWVDFYKEELAKRKILGFPPFWNALKIESSAGKRSEAESKLNKLSNELSKSYINIKTLGPSPSFIERKINKFHWQLIVMSKNRKLLVEIAKNLPVNFKKDLDPINFL